MRKTMNTQLSKLAALAVLTATLLLVGAQIAAAQMTEASTTAQDILNESIFNNISRTLYVNPANSAASDQNAGTANEPLRTLGRAAEMAMSINRQNQGVRVLISAGVYRESFSLGSGGTNAPMVIEGVPGQTIISGSDVWGGWQSQSGNIYTHDWNYDWGLAPIPSGWVSAGLNVSVPDIIRRREMIFVNGRSLRQVLNRSELGADTFYVDEGQNQVTISMANALNISSAQIEVATRGVVFRVTNRQNIAVRGLTVQHGTLTFAAQAYISDCNNILLENNAFQWSSDAGLQFVRTNNIVSRNNTYSNNGGTGYSGSYLTNLLSENESATRNNWRGYQGNFMGWALAGVKHLYITNATYRNLSIRNNFTYGLWFDTRNRNLTVEGATITNNVKAGVYLEASMGPIAIRNSIIANNGNEGIRSANVKNITLENNIFYGNGTAQIYFTGENSGRPSGGEWLWPAENYILRNNIIIAKNSTQPVIRSTLSSDVWATFVNTLTSNTNTWYNLQTPSTFGVGSGRYLNLAGWQTTTNEDANSRFQNCLLYTSDAADE